MKKLFALSMIFLSAIFFSCERELQTNASNSKIILTASLEQPSDVKTTVREDKSVVWDATEEIKVFCNGKTAKFTSLNDTQADVAGFMGDGIVANDGDEIWALYPYDENATLSEGTITTTIPCDQIARPGSFARNTNVTIARSAGKNLQFRNVCGGVRFSLTQKGITKVIFEGLDGEAIAGKVKIGFDGSGLPVIKEVVDGHMFITLSAPAGTSFESGQWYYISALPGTLEKGFKMRFFIGDKYSKLLSAGSRTIKRSIFGSISNADSNTQFVTPSSNAPQTKEDIRTAFELVDNFAPYTEKILSRLKASSADGKADPQAAAEEIAKLEGVTGTEVTGMGNVAVKTKDKLCVNVILGFDDQADGGFTTTKSMLGFDIRQNSVGTVKPGSKKAIILSPVFTETINQLNIDENGKYSAQLDEWARTLHYEKTNILKNAGYAVEAYYDEDATLDRFRGSNLEQYGVVYINTHGGWDIVTHSGDHTTAYQTGTRWSPNLIENMVGVFGTMASCVVDGSTYLWMTAKTMAEDNPEFDNTLFMAHSCYSFTTDEMASAVLSRGAAGYCGYTVAAEKITSHYLVTSILQSLAEGLELDKASEDAKSRVSLRYGGSASSLEKMKKCFKTQKSIPSFYLTDKDDIDSGKYEYVDLGLGVKWATFNLGATKPEQLGNYYQWAGTQNVTNTDIELNWDNCPYHTIGSTNYLDWTKYIPVGKFSYWSGPGASDNKTTLEAEDDIVQVKLKGKWRMPTIEEWKELMDECWWIWTDSYNDTGVAGMIVKSDNGKSIFLPASGRRFGTNLDSPGDLGLYWSSTVYRDYPEYAYAQSFTKYVGYNYISRFTGLCVRPVYSEVEKEKSKIDISPEYLDFGNVTIGKSLTKSLTVKNTGTKDIKVSEISAIFAEYSFDWTSGVIKGGQSKTINVTFRPTEEMLYPCYIYFETDADNIILLEMLNIPAEGRGVK